MLSPRYLKQDGAVTASTFEDPEFSLSCVLAGCLVDTALFGVMIAQLLRYAAQSNVDSLWTRSIVFIGCTASTAASGESKLAIVLTTGYTWYYTSNLFVHHFGDFSPFGSLSAHAWYPIMDTITAAFIKSFFAYRAFRLNNRNWLILAGIGVLVAAHTLAIVITVYVRRLNDLTDVGQTFAEHIVWLVSSMAADLIITVCILMGLYGSRTGWTHTDKLITRLIRMTLESQIPALIGCLIFVVEFCADNESVFSLTMEMFQSKLYVLGLLYSLTARIHLSTVNDTVMMNDTMGMSFNHEAAGIHVHIETETHEAQVDRHRLRQGINRRTLQNTTDDSDGSDKSGTAFESLGYGSDMSKVQFSTPAHSRSDTPPTKDLEKDMV